MELLCKIIIVAGVAALLLLVCSEGVKLFKQLMCTDFEE